MSSPIDHSPEPRQSQVRAGYLSRNEGLPRGRKPHKRREYKTYNYDPLPRGRGIIRLLNLFSSENPDAEILCELITPTADEKPQYPYEALSWCWGTAEKTVYIRIQRHNKTWAKYVSPNLVAALKALRHPDRNRYLWIDMICIDQENLDEKNHQVEMMHDIYGNAERVCIWLGEGDESSRTALRFIRDEVSHLQSFDTLCDSKDSSKKWVALLDLMQRPWFSRRWVVQELALAQNAVIYCGYDRISWKKFAIAVELLVEVETATHRLSEVMKKDRQYQYIPSYFEFVSALGASLLVDANERLFRDYKETETVQVAPVLNFDPESASESDVSAESSDSDDSEANDIHSPNGTSAALLRSRNRIQPLLSLEYLVSSLTIFETSQPHDTIYALLAIAKDTTPRAVDSKVTASSGRAQVGLEIYTQRKSYNVDYNLPYVDVCKEFIMFAVERSAQADRSRALDVICRPWAVEERHLKRIREKKQQAKIKRERDAKREHDRNERRQSKSGPNTATMPSSESSNPRTTGTDSQADKTTANSKFKDLEDMPLPSWIPQLSGAPHAMAHRPGHAGPKMSRINADPLVGLPSMMQRNYAAAETKVVDMKSLRFRKRAELGHFSMYARGFRLDDIEEVEQVARNGQIPREWAELAQWQNTKKPPPDDFWRTLVANRGKDGKNPPVYYSRACQESFKKGGLESGAVDTTALIEYERNSVVAQFCRRVQAVTWNRALIKTTVGKLGLVRKDVEKGDWVCILYGCSVPIILRRSKRKTEEVFAKELEDEISYVYDTIAENFKKYTKRKRRHEQQKRTEMHQLCQQWLKSTDWMRTNGFSPRKSTNQEIRNDLMQILRRAIEDFGRWRSRNRQKAWREHTRKAEQEAKEQKAKEQGLSNEPSNKDMSKQFDDLLLKRKVQEQKAHEHRKRRKSRAAFDLTGPPTNHVAPDAVPNGIPNGVPSNVPKSAPNGVSKNTPVAIKKQKTLIDWWSFEYALVAGRRWRRIVQERKQEREAFALKRTEVHWSLMQQDEHQAFKQAREAARKLATPPAETRQHQTPSSPNGQETQSEDQAQPLNGRDIHSEDQAQHLNGQETQPGDQAQPLNGRAIQFEDQAPPAPASRPTPASAALRRPVVRPSWVVKHNKEQLNEAEGIKYNKEIRENLRKRLGPEGYYSYELLGECYIHGMMDGEAMLFQNEGEKEVIPSMVFEIR